jgi:hypothetical protein
MEAVLYSFGMTEKKARVRNNVQIPPKKQNRMDWPGLATKTWGF